MSLLKLSELKTTTIKGAGGSAAAKVTAREELRKKVASLSQTMSDVEKAKEEGRAEGTASTQMISIKKREKKAIARNRRLMKARGKSADEQTEQKQVSFLEKLEKIMTTRNNNIS